MFESRGNSYILLCPVGQCRLVGDFIMYDVIAAVCFAFMTGSFLMLYSRVRYSEKIWSDQMLTSRAELADTKKDLKNKVEEFDEVTKQASEANNSMGEMLSEMSEKVIILDERVSMLSGAATATGAGTNIWQQNQQRKKPKPL